MKKLIVPLIVLTLLAGAEAVARKVEGVVPAPLLWDTQFSQDKADQIEGFDEQIEVVFMGSSVVQANIDPELFAEMSPQFDTAYNAGLPSMTPRVWREFLVDTVYEDHCPSLVVIGVDIRQFSDNKPGSEGQLDRYLGTRGRLQAVGEDDIWLRAEDWLESNSALFRVRPRLREPDKVVAWVWKLGDRGDWRNTNLTDFGRYQSNDARTYEASEARLDALRDGAFKDLSFGGAETAALRGMIDDALAIGATPVLVEMPSMGDQLARAMPNGAADREWMTSVLNEVAAAYGIPLIRVPEMDNDPVYYSDDYHMNLTGVETITGLLAEQIAALDLEYGAGFCATTP